MTITEQIITIGLCVLATMLTRFLPFIVFPQSKTPPEAVLKIGKMLPPAMMGLLVVYCLKGVSFISTPFGIPEIIGIAATTILHLWKRQMLISIAGGTAVYMLLVQLVF